MKKKLVTMLVALMVASSLAGCGNAETPDKTMPTDVVENAGTEATNSEEGSVESENQSAQTMPQNPSANYPALKDFNVEDYVTLGEYKGIAVTVPKTEITQEHAKELANNAYRDALSSSTGIVVEDGIKDRAVKDGDVVNIDYVGKLNDVAFDGGTAEKAYLGIGYDMFIEGFEDGLIGVMPGETVDLNLTFPKDYGSADLAGQSVVFTVTVNYIMPEGYHPDIIASLGLEGVTDQASLEKHSYDYLVETEAQNRETEAQNAILETFINNCTFAELPEIMLEKYEAMAAYSLETSAAMFGIDAATLAQMAYGMTYDQMMTDMVPKTVMHDFALQAVANKENLNLTDEELEEMIKEEMAEYGYPDVDTFLADLGSTREDYREYFMYDKVMAFLVENAVITEAE